MDAKIVQQKCKTFESLHLQVVIAKLFLELWLVGNRVVLHQALTQRGERLICFLQSPVENLSSKVLHK